MICAWIDTSSAVVGSSATISSRLGGQRQRDHHALAHAAGELVRVLVDALLGGRDAGFLQQARWRAARASSALDRQVRQDGFDQLPADRVQRVQRGQRVLEDRADAAAADARASARSGRLSMRRPSSRISPPAMRPGGSSRPMMAAPVSDLPAPDSPTTPRISPGAMSKRDVVQRQQRAAARGELDAQVLDFEQRVRVIGVFSAVAG